MNPKKLSSPQRVQFGCARVGGEDLMKLASSLSLANVLDMDQLEIVQSFYSQ
ncbi:hypothetical protein COLO4_21280 [Corchorus olitorius]|uniref:Uncharacterized protein n=1 Tax=Corchorus olitorius TaxID=93759 RepID=A0A1R3IUC4_9ROSI|nr:hypothetical protein COLO4_21280 [Corchorus olitorius]